MKKISKIILLLVLGCSYSFAMVSFISSNDFVLKNENDMAYVLDLDEWEIVEGEVSDDVALKNKTQINKAIKYAFYKQYKIFELGKMNVYFDVQADNYNRATEESVLLQSNMHFKMSNNTVLRVQPHSKASSALLSAWKKENITVSGGKIIGDRYEHDYKTVKSTHEYGFGIYFRGVLNGVVDGVELRECTGDGFIVQSTKRRLDDGTERPNEVYSKNIVLKNCTLDKNRRNNISLTDVDGMLIENNIISNGGDGGKWNKLEGYSSKGVLPRYNIDLEAINYLNNKGELRYTEIVRNVIIRNNIFSGAQKGDIDLYKCWNVEITENIFDSYIANVASFDIEIHNNTFKSRRALNEAKFAIQISEKIRASGKDFNVNYKIYNNTIRGYKNGINLGATDGEVFDNKIENCQTGIMLLNGTNNYLHDNTITSNLSGSRGYYNSPKGIKVNDVSIKNEIIEVQEYALLFTKLKGTVSIADCTFIGYKGMEFRNSDTIVLENVTSTKYTNIESKVVEK